MAYPVIGSGSHRYEVIHDWLTPPEHIRWGDTHALCQDKAGHIYVGHTVHPTSESADAIAVFDAEGNFIRSFGEAFRGGSHGMELREEDGQEFIYHCDTNRRLVVKTTLDGEVVWEKGTPEEAGVYNVETTFIPTNIAFAPNGDFYVADGYGGSYVHQFNQAGDYIRTIGTPGGDAGQFKCPHGLCVDDRGDEPRLLVADRGNRRLQYFTLDGQYISTVTAGMRLPCHLQTRGKMLLVPDLESVVTLLDGDNEVIAQLGQGAGYPNPLRDASRDELVPGQFVHPHSAIFLQTGDILVAEWIRIGRLTLLRRLEA